MQVELTHIYISDGHNYFGRYGKDSLGHSIVEKDQVQLVAGSGILGDRFFDYEENYKGQITFFSHSTFEAVRDEHGISDVDPKQFRRNVVLKGLNAEALIGKRFSIGELEFTGSCEAKPCFWMDEACGEGTYEFLKGRGGLRARITKGGMLTVGIHSIEILGDVELDLSKD